MFCNFIFLLNIRSTKEGFYCVTGRSQSQRPQTSDSVDHKDTKH